MIKHTFQKWSSQKTDRNMIFKGSFHVHIDTLVKDITNNIQTFTFLLSHLGYI